MRLAIAFCVVVCALAAPGASASPARAPSPAAAKTAFGRLLHHLYGGIRGFWTCPPPAINGRIDCLAEVHAGSRWHRVSAAARHGNGVVSLSRVSAETWTRHWSPYSRHFILRSDESQVPGVVSVNGPAYDWGWLAVGAGGVKDGETRRVDALDGDVSGLTRFFFFSCSARAGLIVCRNALGDAMRYRPHPT
jgi:hypothetical protein